MVFGQRRGSPADLLVIGLGNPGEQYAHSRHNVGADTVSALARRHGGDLRHQKKEHAEVAELRVGDKRIVVAFPLTFYNEAGRAATALVRRHGIETADRVVVIHDELDLPVGRIKLKAGGGLAGNNGLKSIKAHLRTDEFLRIRIGVDKPPGPMAGKDYVLKKPGKRDRVELDIAIERAADAVELILSQGVDAAMAEANRR